MYNVCISTSEIFKCAVVHKNSWEKFKKLRGRSKKEEEEKGESSERENDREEMDKPEKLW